MHRQSGFFKIHRKIFDNDLFAKKPAARHLFMDLIALAAWKDCEQDWRGKPVALARGQIMTSTRALADLTGMGRQSVRTILANLAAHNAIKTNPLPNNGPIIITVCNYCEYQDQQPTTNPPANPHLTHSQPTKEEEKKLKDIVSNETIVAGEPADLLGDQVPKPIERKPSQPIVEAFDAWNETAQRCALPQSRSLSPARRRSINARLTEHGLEGWQEALANIERSAFLTGENDRGWRIDLDFLIKPDKFERVRSGGYGNGRHASAAGEGDMTPELRAKILAEYGVELQ